MAEWKVVCRLPSDWNHYYGEGCLTGGPGKFEDLAQKEYPHEMIIILGDLVKRIGGDRYSLSGNEVIGRDLSDDGVGPRVQPPIPQLPPPEELLRQARQIFTDNLEDWQRRLQSGKRWHYVGEFVKFVLSLIG